jgi:hypothetical protein
MNENLIKFIELCLVDGIITEKEREVIFRKSKELGVPEDECEVIIDSMLYNHSKSPSVKDHRIDDNIKTDKFELKKIPKIEKLKFDKRSFLEKEIVNKFELIQESENWLIESQKTVSHLGKEIEQKKINLINEVVQSLNNVDLNQSFRLGRFDFVVDELIKESNIKEYLNNHGSIEYGSKNGNYNPEYPHPVSVIFNHVKLGYPVNDNGSYLSGYISGNSFSYFKSEPIMILDINDRKPKKVIVHNQKKDLKFIILVFEDDFQIYRLQYSFELSKIEHKKNWFGTYELNNTGLYHTVIEVKHRLLDPFF